MGHQAIIGFTGSGKSRMMRELILPAWQTKKVAALILDPICQPWGAGAPWVWQTADHYAFLEKARQSRRCVLVADECAMHVGASSKIARDLAWLPCASRNHGHVAYFMAQRTTHLPPSYRSQCSEGYVFFQPDMDEAELSARQFGLEPRVWAARIRALPLGQCYRVQPGREPQRLKIF